MTINLLQTPGETQPVSSIEKGSQRFLAVLWRLIAMELQTLRRRTLSKVLLAIGIGSVVLFLLVVGIATFRTISRPVSDYTPPLCSTSPHTVGCVHHIPTLLDRVHYKQLAVQNFAHVLSLPGCFLILSVLLVGVLVMLMVTLVGSMVGGEYSLGTVRLLFTRGPTRLQFLLAKVVTTALCIVAMFLMLTGVTLLVGALLYNFSGMLFNTQFFSADWLSHALLFLGWCMFDWFVYGMMALFFSTVGRSTVAGIVGPLIWLVTESFLTQLLHLIAGGSSGLVGSIPNYFVGNSLGALIQNQAHVVYGATLGPLSDLQALLVIALYLTLFLSLACRLTVSRDVINS